MIDAKVDQPQESTDYAERIMSLVRRGRPVRRKLPEFGRIHIDRPLPFLVVYRRRVSRPVEGTERLAASQPSYMMCTARSAYHEELSDLADQVARELSGQFGSFLMVELWTSRPTDVKGQRPAGWPRPGMTLVVERGSENEIEGIFSDALRAVTLNRRRAQIQLRRVKRVRPPRMRPLLSGDVGREARIHTIGIELEPVYVDPESGRIYPDVLRDLNVSLTRAMRRAFFEFSRVHTTQRPRHYHVFGRRAIVKAVWKVDGLLDEASSAFDLLLQVTPINIERAWRAFSRSGYEKAPRLQYRPLPADPIVLKRKLYRAPIEQLEDPALALLFREKLQELDRQISMLQDLGTPEFLHASIQAFGSVDTALAEVASEILERIPPRSRESGPVGFVDAKAFARLAREELASYLIDGEPIDARVEVREDVTGLMVSKGNLLVGASTRIPHARVDALIQHELGTHVLTYHNGRTQRFRQLSTGLAGYESLQEGIAVLAEYLVGGLTRPRLRLLAGRVEATSALLRGADFPEVFRLLTVERGFPRRTAFGITVRVFRGGGFTKDALYLKGLEEVIQHLQRGGALEPLFVGKIAAKHIQVVNELKWRGILREPPLIPAYLKRNGVEARLEAVRGGLPVWQMAEKKKR